MEQVNETKNEAPKKSRKKIDARTATLYIVRIALLAAMSIALMYLNFPIFPGLPAKMDFADIPVVIGAVTLGPWSGMLILAVKCLLYAPQSLANSGGIGTLSNFICATPFVLLAGYLFKTKKNIPALIIGLIAGAFASAFISYFSNRFAILPLYKLALGFDAMTMLWLFVALTAVKFSVAAALAFPLSVVLLKYVFKEKNFLFKRKQSEG